MGDNGPTGYVGEHKSTVIVARPFWYEVFDTYPMDKETDLKYRCFYFHRDRDKAIQNTDRQAVRNGVNVNDLSAMRVSIALRGNHIMRGLLQNLEEKKRGRAVNDAVKNLLDTMDKNHIIPVPLSPGYNASIIGNVTTLKQLLEAAWGITRYRFHRDKGCSYYGLQIQNEGKWAYYRNMWGSQGGFEGCFTSNQSISGQKGILIMTTPYGPNTEVGYLAALWDGQKMVGGYDLCNWTNAYSVCSIYFWKLSEGGSGDVRGGIKDGVYDYSMPLNDKSLSYLCANAYYNCKAVSQTDLERVILDGMLIKVFPGNSLESVTRREFSVVFEISKKDENSKTPLSSSWKISKEFGTLFQCGGSDKAEEINKQIDLALRDDSNKAVDINNQIGLALRDDSIAIVASILNPKHFKVDRVVHVNNIGNVITITNTGIDFFEAIREGKAHHAAINLGIGVSSILAGSRVGGPVGTFIGGPIGTAMGIVAGAVVGAAISIVGEILKAHTGGNDLEYISPTSTNMQEPLFEQWSTSGGRSLTPASTTSTTGVVARF